MLQILDNSDIIGATFVLEVSDCILHQERQSILACLKVWVSCLYTKYSILAKYLNKCLKYKIYLNLKDYMCFKQNRLK